MSRTTLFLGGIPTKPDVDKLRAAFGVPKVGELILHERYEQALGMKRTEHRFHTVRETWHQALRAEHRCIMGAVRGRGYVRLDDNEMQQHSVSKEKSGFRHIRRAYCISELTDSTKLSPENLKAKEHMGRRSSAVRLALATEAKAITLPDLEKRGN